LVEPGVTPERDNNGNADDADLADRRGFSECDALAERDINMQEDADLADLQGF